MGENRRRILERAGHAGHRARVKKVSVQHTVHHPHGFVGADAVGALSPWSTTRLEHDPGAQAHQVLVVTAVERQIDDVRVIERAAQRGIGRLHQRNRFSYGECLSLLAGLQTEVNPNFSAHLQNNILPLLPPQIFSCIQRTKPGRGGEIQLTDALRLLAKEHGLWALTCDGKTYDAGDKLGFLKATVEMALANQDLGEAFRKYLKSLKL